MRHQARRGIVLATVLVLATAGTAFADLLQADGDGDTVFGASGVAFGDVCRGRTYSKPVDLAVRRQGTGPAVVFRDGAVVSFGFRPFESSPGVTESGNGAQIVNGAGVTLSAGYDTSMPTITTPVLVTGTDVGWFASPAGATTGRISGLVDATTTLQVPVDAPLGDPNASGSNGTVRWSASGLNRQAGSLLANLTFNQANEWNVLDQASRDCNRPPTVQAVFRDLHATCAGTTLDLTLGDLDLGIAGSNEDLDITIAWGDGTQETHGGLTATSPSYGHVYAQAGQYTARVTVEDQHGASVSAEAPTTVDLVTTGITQPVNADGSSIFKAGSTVPVKVRFADCDGSIPNDLAPSIAVTKLSGAAPTVGVEEPASTSAADTGTTMRFSDGQWIYNLATRSLSDPTARYRLTITVARTGQTVVVEFGLR